MSIGTHRYFGATLVGAKLQFDEEPARISWLEAMATSSCSTAMAELFGCARMQHDCRQLLLAIELVLDATWLVAAGRAERRTMVAMAKANLVLLRDNGAAWIGDSFVASRTVRLCALLISC